MIYAKILEAKKKRKKLFALLIDPDKFSPEAIRCANRSKADYILVGGSSLQKRNFRQCIAWIKSSTQIPLVIFPGSREQISEKADAIFLLSLISGRNPDFLIGEHVAAAQKLKRSGIEIIPTGYILVNGGTVSTTQKVTRTAPIGSSDTALAVSTALAGELLGMKLIYLEAGSGAKRSVNERAIRAVNRNISVPLITGGGIDSGKKAKKALSAGADMIVVGNAAEKNIAIISEISDIVHNFRT